MKNPKTSASSISSTREEILTRLLRRRRTVAQLADELGLSRNAVRTQLTALERDGLVNVARHERGRVGKPAFIYELTVEGERYSPRAYGEVFRVFVEAAVSRLGAAEAEELLRDAGRRAARERAGPKDGSWQDRVSTALAIVEGLGGTPELHKRNGHAEIEGLSCPLAEIVSAHPEACALLEALLAEILGVPVEEACEKGDRPRCRFLVGRDSASG